MPDINNVDPFHNAPHMQPNVKIGGKSWKTNGWVAVLALVVAVVIMISLWPESKPVDQDRIYDPSSPEVDAD